MVRLQLTMFEKEALVTLPADVGDQGVFQADGLFVDAFGPEGFEIALGAFVEIGHDEQTARSRPASPAAGRGWPVACAAARNGTA